jgi:DAK2 domain fusion protein YloV
MINRMTGTDFCRMITHGAYAITAQKQPINELNVFPVPDGDTGTNMCMTFSAAAKELTKKEYRTLGEAASATASSLLRGARGNSGVILSLLFRGFGKSVKELDTADGADFAIAIDHGVAAAYKAVMKPAEGTILTVSRKTAQRAAGAAREERAVEYVMEQAIMAGYEALAETVHQNPVLQKAGVVDAGGKGFLIILEGMLAGLRGEPLPELPEDEDAPAQKADFASYDAGDITFGYCTEFICSRDKKKDPEALRGFLSSLGDSLVLVDDEEIIKVHVHTNHPGKVLEEALTYGALLTVKIENMREQHTEIAHSAPAPSEPQVAAPEKKFGTVAVCVGQGLTDVFFDLGADGVISGGQTMNPSTEDILREVLKVPAEIVFLLPNNKNIIMAAEQCQRICKEKQVIVVPTTTVPQGVSAMLNFDPEGDVGTMSDNMMAAAGLVSTSQITYAARDSDFDGFQMKEGDYLALAEGKLFGTDTDLTALLNHLAEAESQQNAEFITLYYGEDVKESAAQIALAIFQDKCPNAELALLSGGQPVYYYMIAAE